MILKRSVRVFLVGLIVSISAANLSAFEGREPLRSSHSVEEVVTVLSDGTENARFVLEGILEETDDEEVTLGIWLTLDDMNMRGNQIWVAFAGFAQGDMEFFQVAILSRSQDMVDYVNARQDPNFPYQAVTSGASQLYETLIES